MVTNSRIIKLAEALECNLEMYIKEVVILYKTSTTAAVFTMEVCSIPVSTGCKHNIEVLLLITTCRTRRNPEPVAVRC